MIIPRYWAEHRIRSRKGNKQFTVKRFGWSDLNQADAERHARDRAEAAVRDLESNSNITLRERKIAYNGSDGLPIREEVLAVYDDTVITRNSYGAHCLNSPNVFFIDVDNPEYKWGFGYLFFIFTNVAMVAFTYATTRSIKLSVAAMVLWLLVLVLIETIVNGLSKRNAGDPLESVLANVQSYVEQHPDWLVAVYRTPLGVRLIALHRLFDPHEQEVEDAFLHFRADPTYVRMCRLQACFRARVTAKPWRAGILDHMRPRPGVWPVKPESIERRSAWIDRYEQVSKQYAACHYLKKIGGGMEDSLVRKVVELHDQLSQAQSELPLA